MKCFVYTTFYDSKGIDFFSTAENIPFYLVAYSNQRLYIYNVKQTQKLSDMKNSAIIINSSIALKSQNGVMGFNFYEWLQQVKKDRFPEESLISIWKRVCIAFSDEKSCYSRMPLN